MEYTTLGRTGVKISRLCLGTMNFGPETTEPDSHAIMSRALELGYNFWDTADVYGWKQDGWTEQIIGRWFEAGGNRDEVVLATKCYNPMGKGPNDRGLSARYIRRACEDSLRRLQTDRIDLYQMHHVERTTPWEEIWQAMELLVAQGKVLYVGSSNFAAWHIVRAQESAARRHFLGLVTEQSIYNLAVRSIELEVLPACREYGIGVIPWSPLSGGMLSGVLQKTAGGRRAKPQVQDRIKKFRPQLKQWEAFCQEMGEDPSHVGLAWLLAQPGVTSPIIGPRTMEQLEKTSRALEIKMDSSALEQLDQIWPGPGGAAPEAYAW